MWIFALLDTMETVLEQQGAHANLAKRIAKAAAIPQGAHSAKIRSI